MSRAFFVTASLGMVLAVAGTLARLQDSDLAPLDAKEPIGFYIAPVGNPSVT